MISEINEKGVITFVNDDYCKVTGYSFDELIGNLHYMIRPNQMPKTVFKELWHTILKGEIWNGTVKKQTKNGNFYWVNVTVYPSKSSTGEISYISVKVKPIENKLS